MADLSSFPPGVKEAAPALLPAGAAAPLNVLSLFAGVGGLDLGLERAGMTVAEYVGRLVVAAHHHQDVTGDAPAAAVTPQGRPPTRTPDVTPRRSDQCPTTR